MVRREGDGRSGVRSTYYLKPGQTLENTKPSERTLALIVPKSVYDGYQAEVHEAQSIAERAEREAKRLAALKQATYNMSKHWEDTAHNIQKRRRDELLSRRKLEEAERVKFTKDMAKKNAEFRAKVVKHAKEIIMYRRPQCRMINNALFLSEVLRERSEQLEAKRKLDEKLAQAEVEEGKAIMEDVKKFHEEEGKKREKRMIALRNYKIDLKKQIEENETNLKRLESALRKTETEDMQNMNKELEEIAKKEMEEEFFAKKKLNKMFLDAIEDKRKEELHGKEEEEFRDKNLKIYQEFKFKTERMMKENARLANAEKIRKTEMLGRRFAKFARKKYADDEEANEKKEKSAKEMEEKAKLAAIEAMNKEKEKKLKLRKEMTEYMKTHEEEMKARKKEEEEDLLLWETLQRYKRDEFDKEWLLRKKEEDKNNRLNYGQLLKKQMEFNEEKRKQAEIDEDDSKIFKVAYKNENDKVLAYGEKVLEESKGVRPVYPIVKVIENFKRDIGLVRRNREEDVEEAKPRPRRKQGRRKFPCPPLDEEKAFFFS